MSCKLVTAINALRRPIKPYKCYRRPCSTFPIINTPPVGYHGDSDVNMDLYASVRAKREWVWSRDRLLTAMPRESRKLTIMERLDLIRDPGSKVMHIGTLAGLGLSYGDIPNGCMEVAIVTVCDELCLVTSNDWSLKGGTIYPIGVKKQLRAQEIARENKLPCIYIADSGGAFLPLQAGLYPDKEHGGRVFRNQAVLSSLGIPQIAVVVGPCTAGGAYIPAMSDEAIIVQDIGTLYIAGPPLVKAATGVKLSAEELGGAKVHCSISGCTDHYAETEEEALQSVRAIVNSMNLSQRSRTVCAIEQPLYEGADSDWAGLIPTHKQGFSNWPILEVISRLVDGSRLRQFKELYGTGLCTGFARIGGHLVGVIANSGTLGYEEGLKGAHFIRLCTLRSIPLLFMVNVSSEIEYLSSTGSDGLAAKGRAQMMTTLASANVPKLTVVLGGGYGPSYYAMCGRPMQPNFLFHWPHARCALAAPQHMLDHMTQDGNDQKYRHQFEQEESTLLTSDLCNDDVILPSETREMLIHCLDICTRYDSHSKPAELGMLRM